MEPVYGMHNDLHHREPAYLHSLILSMTFDSISQKTIYIKTMAYLAELANANRLLIKFTVFTIMKKKQMLTLRSTLSLLIAKESTKCS